MNQRLSGIYCWLNTVNGKRYVGCSNNIAKRKLLHIWNLRNNKNQSRFLQHAWNKHGESVFVFQIIEECEESTLDDREIFWIKYYDSTNPECGYNLESGGNKNKRMSAETRLKMSQSRKGYKASPESRMRMSQAQRSLHKTFKHTDEAKRKISEAGKGRKKTPEAIAKTSLANRGRVMSEQQRLALSLRYRGSKRSPEDCAKISSGMMGHAVSAATRERISAAHKGHHRPWSESRRRAYEQKYLLTPSGAIKQQSLF